MSLFKKLFGDKSDEALPADINGRDKEGWTPLHWAVTSEDKGNERRVKALIGAGADVNTQNIHGRTPLMAAVTADSLENVKTLIAAGADVNVRDKYNESALYWAKSDAVAHVLKAAGATE